MLRGNPGKHLEVAWRPPLYQWKALEQDLPNRFPQVVCVAPLSGTRMRMISICPRRGKSLKWEDMANCGFRRRFLDLGVFQTIRRAPLPRTTLFVSKCSVLSWRACYPPMKACLVPIDQIEPDSSWCEAVWQPVRGHLRGG